MVSECMPPECEARTQNTRYILHIVCECVHYFISFCCCCFRCRFHSICSVLCAVLIHTICFSKYDDKNELKDVKCDIMWLKRNIMNRKNILFFFSKWLHMSIWREKKITLHIVELMHSMVKSVQWASRSFICCCCCCCWPVNNKTLICQVAAVITIILQNGWGQAYYRSMCSRPSIT